MTIPPQPIDEVALRNEFKHLLFRPIHIDHQNIEPDDITITKEGKDHYLDEMVKIAAQAVTAALKRVDEAIPDDSVVTTKYGYHSEEKKYGYRIGTTEAHQAITNELQEWEKK